MINGTPINEIARNLKISTRTLEEKLKTVARWTAQDAAIQRETWATVTMNRLEAALNIIMKQIRKYQDWDDHHLDGDVLEIDYRVFDKLESLLKTQAQIQTQIYGSKNPAGGTTINNNIFTPTLTAGTRLHNIAVAREQEQYAGQIMPSLLPSRLPKHPELDLEDDRRGIIDSD